jgi:hypothetical protein
MWQMQDIAHEVLKRTASYMTDSVQIKIGFFNANAKIMMLYTSDFKYEFTGASYETNNFECFKPWFQDEDFYESWELVMFIVYAIDLLGIIWVVFDTMYKIKKVFVGIDTIKPWDQMYSRRSCIFWCCLRKSILMDYDREEGDEKYHDQKAITNSDYHNPNGSLLMSQLVSEPPIPGLTKFQTSAQEKKDSSIVIEKKSDMPKGYSPEFQ